MDWRELYEAGLKERLSELESPTSKFPAAKAAATTLRWHRDPTPGPFKWYRNVLIGAGVLAGAWFLGPPIVRHFTGTDDKERK